MMGSRDVRKAALLAVALAVAGTFGWAAVPAPEQRVGAHFDISPTRLAAPHATPAVGNPSEDVARPAGAMPQLPAGFRVNIFAEKLSNPRWFAVAPNGDVFVAESEAGKITLLRDANGDGKAEQAVAFAGGFDRPHGLAFHDGALYVGDVRTVWRIPYANGDEHAASSPPLPRACAIRSASHFIRVRTISTPWSTNATGSATGWYPIT